MHQRRRSAPGAPPRLAIVAADLGDHDHRASVDALARPDLRLVVPALVLAEAGYVVGRRLGATAESAFLRGVAALDVEGPTTEDFVRMAELVDEYRDLPLGSTDASVVALAERLSASVIVTLDRRHFGAVRPRHVSGFRAGAGLSVRRARAWRSAG